MGNEIHLPRLGHNRTVLFAPTERGDVPKMGWIRWLSTCAHCSAKVLVVRTAKGMVSAQRPKTEEELYALKKHECSRLRRMVVDRRRRRAAKEHLQDASERAR